MTETSTAIDKYLQIKRTNLALYDVQIKNAKSDVQRRTYQALQDAVTLDILMVDLILQLYKAEHNEK